MAKARTAKMIADGAYFPVIYRLSKSDVLRRVEKYGLTNMTFSYDCELIGGKIRWTAVFAASTPEDKDRVLSAGFKVRGH